MDAYITINPPEATNSVGQAHTFTVNVFVDKGNHVPGIPVWEPAPDGTIDNEIDNSLRPDRMGSHYSCSIKVDESTRVLLVQVAILMIALSCQCIEQS